MRLMLAVNKPTVDLPHSSLPGPRPALLGLLLPQEHFVLAEVTEVEVGSPGSPVTVGWRLGAVLENVKRFRARLAVWLGSLTTPHLHPGLVGFVSVPLGDFTSPMFSGWSRLAWKIITSQRAL